MRKQLKTRFLLIRTTREQTTPDGLTSSIMSEGERCGSRTCRWQLLSQK